MANQTPHSLFLEGRAYNRRMNVAGYLPKAVLGALNRGSVVITANQRLARFITQEYDLAKKAQGETFWRTPKVVSWENWVKQLWHQLLTEGHATEMLLNPWQEHAVWRSVLDQEDLSSLKTPDTLAEVAAETWRLLADYEGVERLQSSRGSSDAQTFQQLAKGFQNVCRRNDLLAFSQLGKKLSYAVEKGWLPASTEELLFTGFDSFLPSQNSLIDTLRSHQWKLSISEFAGEATEKFLLEAGDEIDELRIAARWMLSFLKAHPNQRIAVVVPALETKKRQIERIFRDVLAPEQHDIRANSDAAPFEFSLGSSLVESSIIQAAFSVLSWSIAPLPLQEVSSILLSPYLFQGTERVARAEWDAFELRRATTLRPEIALDQMLTLLGGARRRKQLSGLITSLRRLSIAASRLEVAFGEASYSDWASSISELLDVAGWGFGGVASSIEFQMHRRWEEALDAMSTLDFDGSRVNFEAALRALERIARNTIFAPESHNAPIQIMGPLEAAGSRFDVIWFLGAGEYSWPLPENTNPLLSWQLQRELSMPGTNIDRDYEHARAITRRIEASGHTVIFSYAKHISDGPQRISFLLKEIDLEQKSPEEIANLDPPPLFFPLEEIEDSEKVSKLPDDILRGGARVLELQAACGFRAFAEQRLWSRELEEWEPGFDSRENGTVLHQALEVFWEDIRTQDRLREMTDAQRAHTIAQSVELALAKTVLNATSEWDQAYLELQRRRFYVLLHDWIKFELDRSLPFEVEQSEQEFSDAHVGSLRLKVRMDRVDSVENGKVLIDYKTGKAEPSNWLTPRPESPQLPLYAILSADRLEGVAFARVQHGKMGKMGFSGFATSNEVFGKTAKMAAATLEQQIDDWRCILTMLANEFASGTATVDPRKYPGTCRLCAQRLLCRLDTAQIQIDGDDETEDEKYD